MPPVNSLDLVPHSEYDYVMTRFESYHKQKLIVYFFFLKSHPALYLYQGDNRPPPPPSRSPPTTVITTVTVNGTLVSNVTHTVGGIV